MTLSLIPRAATRTSNTYFDTSRVVVAANLLTAGNNEKSDEELLPSSLVEQGGNNRIQQQTIRDCLLQVFIECPISLSTTWRWLRKIGFSYDTRKISFFVDGHHERPNVVFRRNEFCTLYLTKLVAHRWIQVTTETVENWRRENKVSEHDNRGYNYISVDGKNMIEFQIDDLDLFHEHTVTMGFDSFGGNLSVRKPPGVKPLMIFGQDESVYSQFLLGNCQWVVPEGQRPFPPKTHGLSLMISALQSR